MIEIIVGLVVMWLFTPKEEEYDSSSNDEIIRPILMSDFHDSNTDDFGE